jgi:hypothetical protein
MRRACFITAMIAILFVAASPIGEVRWGFEDAHVGKLPGGWSSAKTGHWRGSVWRVIEDATAPSGKHVLAQVSAEGPNPLFNLCVYDETTLGDVDVAVKFKAVAGRIDQGGGPVWRYQDANNYYIARVNPLENNFRVYKVIDGRRTQLDSSEVAAKAGKWHAIRVVQQGDRIQCYFGGKLHLDVQDDTITAAGKVGLWTKADAVTSFDDFTFQSK